MTIFTNHLCNAIGLFDSLNNTHLQAGQTNKIVGHCYDKEKKKQHIKQARKKRRPQKSKQGIVLFATTNKKAINRFTRLQPADQHERQAQID